MTPIQFRFASASTANRLVAGVPAAARIARSWQRAQATLGRADPLDIALEDRGALDPACRAEIARLAAGLAMTLNAPAPDGTTPVCGEDLPDEYRLAELARGGRESGWREGEGPPEYALRRAERRIIRQTGKPGDGIVSRWLNRPLSQAASGWLLRLGWIRPGHATALTALIAAAMLACLVLLGPPGLMAGAILFQLASIADGIDGEIARATFRTSARGAMWDSTIDAVTNIAFMTGVIVNLWQQGARADAATGLVGLAILVTGMTILGLHAMAKGEPLNFDGAKQMLGEDRSRLKTWLRYLTMRDFYCLFFVVMIVLGLASAAMLIFAVAAACWLVAVVLLLRRGGRTKALG